MSDFFWFSDAQWARIGPLLPTDTRGMARVDDRRVLSGIVHALRNGGRWADCPREVYGPKKTLYNRFVRWAERGIWERIFSALAGGEDAPDRLFIDSTCIKVHRCAGGGKGGPWPMASAAPRGAATPSSTLSAMRKAGPSSCSWHHAPPSPAIPESPKYAVPASHNRPHPAGPGDPRRRTAVRPASAFPTSCRR